LLGQFFAKTFAASSEQQRRRPRPSFFQHGVERGQVVFDHPGDAAAIQMIVEDSQVHNENCAGQGKP